MFINRKLRHKSVSQVTEHLKTQVPFVASVPKQGRYKKFKYFEYRTFFREITAQ